MNLNTAIAGGASPSLYLEVAMNRGVPCKYIVRKEYCPYGKKCRFLHQYRGDLNTSSVGEERGHVHGREGSRAQQAQPPRERGVCTNDGGNPEEQGSGDIQISDDAMKNTDENLKGVVRREGEVKNMSQDLSLKGGEKCGTHELKATQRICRFYLINSHCKYGDRCKYVHSSHDRAVKEGRDHLKEMNSHEKRRQKSERKPIESVPWSIPQPSPHLYESSRQGNAQLITSSKGVQQSNPPPLTLASFIGGRAHVQRSHKSDQSQKCTDTLREVCVDYPLPMTPAPLFFWLLVPTS